VDVNAYCEDYQTALHVAVKQKNHAIATALLNAKADPNLLILPSSVVNDSSLSSIDDKNRYSNMNLIF